MNQLTNRDLMMLEDNVKMQDSIARFAQSCTHLIADAQLKSLCQQIAQDHQQDQQTLIHYVNQR